MLIRRVLRSKNTQLSESTSIERHKILSIHSKQTQTKKLFSNGGNRITVRAMLLVASGITSYFHTFHTANAINIDDLPSLTFRPGRVWPTSRAGSLFCALPCDPPDAARMPEGSPAGSSSPGGWNGTKLLLAELLFELALMPHRPLGWGWLLVSWTCWLVAAEFDKGTGGKKVWSKFQNFTFLGVRVFERNHWSNPFYISVWMKQNRNFLIVHGFEIKRIKIFFKEVAKRKMNWADLAGQVLIVGCWLMTDCRQFVSWPKLEADPRWNCSRHSRRWLQRPLDGGGDDPRALNGWSRTRCCGCWSNQGRVSSADQSTLSKKTLYCAGSSRI